LATVPAGRLSLLQVGCASRASNAHPWLTVPYMHTVLT
jgi:hypothetical protein